MSKSIPLEGNYAPTLATALAALIPYILTTSGASFYAEHLTADIGISEAMLSLVPALATAGYAFGALLAGDLVNRFTQRRLFLICQALLTLGWIASALAGGALSYAAGQIIAGFATGMLLVIALPPVIRNFPASRVPLTAVFINIGLFGAVAGGPMLGGAIASVHGWRWLFGAFAILGLATLAMALATLGDNEPNNPDLPLDKSALLLGVGATVLPFGAAGALAKVGFASPFFLAPFGLGLVCFVALLLTEFHKQEPLAPVKRMWSTWPVVGTIAATIGGAAFVTLLQLSSVQLLKVTHAPPLAAGLSFWPTLLGAIVAAALLGVAVQTKLLPLLVGGAMLLLIAGGSVLLQSNGIPHATTMLVAAGLLGLGAGGSVAPGLFMAGLSLPSAILGRIVALIELVRSVGDFVLAPVMLEYARSASGGGRLDADGVHIAVIATIGCAVAATLIGLFLFVAGGGGLPRPKLKPWIDEDDEEAIASPPLLARWRDHPRVPA